MRVTSWNVDSIRARLPLIEDWLDRTQPDVACWQETKCPARKFPRHAFTSRGYELAATDAGGYGGVAIASRVGLDDVIVGIPGAKTPLNEQRSISATCNGLRIHTIYAPNGRKVGTRHHDIKLAWFALLAAWVGMDGLSDGRPTMLIGDFNIAPYDHDVWEPHRYRKRNLTSPPERQTFQRLVEQGLVEVRPRGDDAPVFTWWNRRSDFFATDRGWRLDHVLADPATARSVVTSSVERVERARDGASDHAPLLVDLAASAGPSPG